MPGGHPRLRADRQRGAAAGDAGGCAGTQPHDADAGQALRERVQPPPRPQRHAVGWALSAPPWSSRTRVAGLHQLRRTRAGARRSRRYCPGLPWSSARHHVGLAADPLVSEHTLSWAIGNTPFEREAAHRVQLDRGLSAAQTREIADAMTRAGRWAPRASPKQLAERTGRAVVPGRRGRPRGERRLRLHRAS